MEPEKVLTRWETTKQIGWRFVSHCTEKDGAN